MSGNTYAIPNRCTNATKHEFPTLSDEASTRQSRGYLKTGANKSALFYWLIEHLDGTCDSCLRATDGHAPLPLVAWFNGGPGSSSLTGFFDEKLGPYTWTYEPGVADNDASVTENQFSWHRQLSAHILFIDFPRGTGMSFVKESEPLSTTRLGAIEELALAFEDLAAKHPHLLKSPLVLTGESYAGQWIPLLSHYMLTHNSSWNLAAIAIGNGFVDPPTQRPVAADKLLWTGVVGGLKQREQVKNHSTLMNGIDDLIAQLKQIQNACINSAQKEHCDLVFAYGTQAGDSLQSMYDFNAHQAPYIAARKRWLLNQESFRCEFNLPPTDALNTSAPNYYKEKSDKVREALASVNMESAFDQLSFVVGAKKIPTLLYFGRFDIRDGLESATPYIDRLDRDVLRNPRRLWFDHQGPSGYLQQQSSLVVAQIDGCGHFVPGQQPNRAATLLRSFVAAALAADGGSMPLAPLCADQPDVAHPCATCALYCSPVINSTTLLDELHSRACGGSNGTLCLAGGGSTTAPTVDLVLILFFLCGMALGMMLTSLACHFRYKKCDSKTKQNEGLLNNDVLNQE